VRILQQCPPTIPQLCENVGPILPHGLLLFFQGRYHVPYAPSFVGNSLLIRFQSVPSRIKVGEQSVHGTASRIEMTAGALDNFAVHPKPFRHREGMAAPWEPI